MKLPLVRGGVGALALLGVVSVSGLAAAHAGFIAPAPRDQGSPNFASHKVGPCGTDAKGAPITRTGKMPAVYFGDQQGAPASATIEVEFEETVEHIGCYQVALSESGNDKDFKILIQTDDPNNNKGKHKISVPIPAGTRCENCTLQFRQVMKGSLCGNNAAPVDPVQAGISTYYSCADVRLGNFDAGPPEVDSGPVDPGGEDAGSSGTPGDGDNGATGSTDGTTGTRGNRTGTSDASDESGCSVGSHAGSGAPLAALAGLGLALVAVARRRRR